MKLLSIPNGLCIKLSKKENLIDWDSLPNLSPLLNIEIMAKGDVDVEIPNQIAEKIVKLSVNAPIEKIVSIDHLKKLEYLKITGTKIKSLNSNFPQNMKFLYLQRNQILSIPDEVFYLEDLRELDLSQNKLTTLPAIEWKLGHLKRLNIEANQLNTLPNGIYHLKNIDHLAVRGNPLDDLTKQQLYDSYKIIIE